MSLSKKKRFHLGTRKAVQVLSCSKETYCISCFSTYRMLVTNSLHSLRFFLENIDTFVTTRDLLFLRGRLICKHRIQCLEAKTCYCRQNSTHKQKKTNFHTNPHIEKSKNAATTTKKSFSKSQPSISGQISKKRLPAWEFQLMILWSLHGLLGWFIGNHPTHKISRISGFHRWIFLGFKPKKKKLPIWIQGF